MPEETSVSTPSALASQLLRIGLPKLLQPLFPHTQGWFRQLAACKAALSANQDKVTLSQLMSPPGPWILGCNEFTIRGADILALLGSLPPGEEDIAKPPLAVVLAAYTALLDVWEQARAAGKLTDDSPPVLVLDEVNVLMDWGEQYKTERQDLLRFFVAISKVYGRSHVVLATSDYSFLTWLSKEIGPGFFRSFVIGDFTPEDAREFLDKHLRQLGQPEVSDDDWVQVHRVCGGNPGTLGQVADCFDDFERWQPALREVAKETWTFMTWFGCVPAADAGYTAADYATAVRAILDSRHKAVDVQQLYAVLGGQSLEALVQANLLALRSYSFWATDISPDAFGPKRMSTVVTAPSALQLYLMKENKETLLAALDSQKAQYGGSNGSSRRPSPTSEKLAAVARDIVGVTAQIQAVEGGIQQVLDEMIQVRQDKSEGWMAVLAALGSDKQQLADEEKQLREQLRQLQEKKLLLMKREDAGKNLTLDGVFSCEGSQACWLSQ